MKFLRALGYSYLINITRSSRAKYAQAFEAEGFEALPERTKQSKVEVKKDRRPRRWV